MALLAFVLQTLHPSCQSARHVVGRVYLIRANICPSSPAGVTAAATWDVDLMYERAKAMGAEFRGKGMNVCTVSSHRRVPASPRPLTIASSLQVALGPMTNLARIVRDSRGFSFSSFRSIAGIDAMLHVAGRWPQLGRLWWRSVL